MTKPNLAYWPLILFLAGIKFILPFLIQSPLYELHRDEYLYYQQGLHPALGFMENPPLISWLATLSSAMGGSFFWIKLWPSLFGAATLVIACLMTAQLGGKRFAQLLTGVAMLTGVFMRMHFLFQPNFLDVFSWTLALYFLIRYTNEEKNSLLYAFAGSLAIGWWSKYSIVFIAAAIVFGLLLSKERKLFARKHFYNACAVALLLILPNIAWQHMHNWPLVWHMKELQETQLRFVNPFDFIKEQFFLLLPVVIVWIAGTIWLAKQKKWRWLLWVYLGVLALLLLGKGKAYYAAGIYPMLLAAGAVAWEAFSQKRKWIRYAITTLILGFSWLIYPLLLPAWEPQKLAAFHKEAGVKHKWEDLQYHDLPQDFADMLGWKELTQKTEQFYHSLPDSIQSHTIILGSNYGEAGALQYYAQDTAFARKVVSTNGSFLLWLPGNFSFEHILFINETEPSSEKDLFHHFSSHTVVDSVTHAYSRQKGTKIIFYQHITEEGKQWVKAAVQQLKDKLN